MKYLICLFLLALMPCLYSQTPTTTLTNDVIIRMVQSGVPTDAIIQTISAARSVNFSFLPYALTALAQANVPDDVVKAMAAKDNGRPLPGTQPPPATAPPVAVGQRAQPSSAGPTRHTTDVERALGHVEILGFAGANAGPNRAPFPNASFTVGAEVAVGLLRNLSVTGTYAFDSLGSVDVVSAHAHEFMGGVRVPFPNRSVATPYLQTSLGGLTVAAGAFGFSVSTTKFAFAPGGGVNFRLARHLGLGIDFRALKAVNVPAGGLEWQYRATGGVSVRF